LINLRWRRAVADERGQSVIEIALTLPLLLLVVIGLTDIARLYIYKTAVTNAAREAAAYAARDPQATSSQICTRARDELGLGSGTCVDVDILSLICTRVDTRCGDDTTRPLLYQTVGQGGADITITLTYKVNLMSGYLLGRAFDLNPVKVGATAWFPGLAE